MTRIPYSQDPYFAEPTYTCAACRDLGVTLHERYSSRSGYMALYAAPCPNCRIGLAIRPNFEREPVITPGREPNILVAPPEP